MKIQMFTFAYGQHFAEALNQVRKTANVLCCGKNEIEWNVIMSGKPVEGLHGFIIRERRERVFVGNRAHSSKSHGDCLNQVHKYMEGCPFIIMDQDFGIIREGWDAIVLDELSEVDVFGASYGPKRKRTGCTPYSMAEIPSVFFMAFRSGIDIGDMDFMPQTRGAEIVREGRMLRDTGFRFAKYVKMKKWRTRVLKGISGISPNNASANYEYQGKLFGIHMGISRCPGGASLFVQTIKNAIRGGDFEGVPRL